MAERGAPALGETDYVAEIGGISFELAGDAFGKRTQRGFAAG